MPFIPDDVLADVRSLFEDDMPDTAEVYAVSWANNDQSWPGPARRYPCKVKNLNALSAYGASGGRDSLTQTVELHLPYDARVAEYAKVVVTDGESGAKTTYLVDAVLPKSRRFKKKCRVTLLNPA